MSITIRTALVTGAAQGIGKGIALELAKDGYQIAVTDLPHQREQALQTVKEIEQLGVKAIFIEADSSNRDQMFKAVDETYEKLGSFNTMINNAGIVHVSPLVEVTEEDIDRINKININGVIWGIQAAAKKFEALDQPGKIINACSIAGLDAFQMMGIYSATKFAVRALTQVAAKELAPKKITVNAYCPGIVLTPMWDIIDAKMGEYHGVPKGETVKKYIDNIALGRGSVPQDIANLVSFLGSEKSDYITGQSIAVDGGVLTLLEDSFTAIGLELTEKPFKLEFSKAALTKILLKYFWSKSEKSISEESLDNSLYLLIATCSNSTASPYKIEDSSLYVLALENIKWKSSRISLRLE
ncbi:hypothetical protein WICPIJ_004252 [Wickerhamomyces pijperi]|uniref:diacetyl reductase [(S)-acetoin forming] n=1 Tax=Wickerhamomyces pijperi TaxID=599730 RepID=A0A9P8Q600_WICPI|nr:hypothetical protein WICPIJ_004252 [Wickerhamomyces pijperi]